MGSTGRIRLMIVDDHIVCCTGFASFFQTVPNIDVAATANGADEAVRQAKHCSPDVVLMDVTLPDRGAFRAAQTIRTCCPRTRVVFIDDTVRHVNAREALRVGAFGYWTKHATLEEIAEAVRRASAGALTFCPSVRSHVVSVPGGVRLGPKPNGDILGRLSEREVEVLTDLANGLSVRECAQRMRLSDSTVDNHKWRLMKKLHVHKAAELTRLAVLEGLVAD